MKTSVSKTGYTRTYHLDGVPLDNGRRWRVLWETGSPGMTGTRLTETDLPLADGTVVQPGAPLESGEIVMVLYVTDVNERGKHGGYRARRENENVIKRLLSKTRLAPGTLTLVEEYTRKAHTIWETQAVLSSSVEVEERTVETCKMTFTLKLPCPRWLETTTRYVECTPDPDTGLVLLDGFTGGSAAVTPLWVIAGPVSTFEVTDTVSGGYTRWAGDTIPAGSLLALDAETYSWGVAPLGEKWPLVEESTEWETPLVGNTARVEASAPIYPDATGKYWCEVKIDGGVLPGDRVRVMCRGRKGTL